MRAAAVERSELEQLTRSIEERVARGEPVSQEEWDRAAELFDDGDIDALVPPDAGPPAAPMPQRAGLGLPPPAAGGVSARLPRPLGELIRDALADASGPGRRKRS